MKDDQFGQMRLDLIKKGLGKYMHTEVRLKSALIPYDVLWNAGNMEQKPFPASSLHCRVKDYLFSRVAISKQTESTMFLRLLSALQHLGYIEGYETSLPFESQIYHPGSPFPAPSP